MAHDRHGGSTRHQHANDHNKIIGHCIGIVKANADDKHSGQVRISLPMLDNSEEGDETQEQTHWARVVCLFAGGAIGDAQHSPRGAHFMPEVGDEVLVAFEHGSIEKPYIIGSLFSTVPVESSGGSGGGSSGGAQPNPSIYSHTQDKGSFKTKTKADRHPKNPPRAGQNDVSGFQTRSGHSLSMNDHPSGGHIGLTSSGGNMIHLLDGGLGIEIKDAAGNLIQLGGASGGENGASANWIVIKAAETIKLDAKDIVLNASNSITTKSGQGTSMECNQFTLKMKSGTITSSGALSIKAQPLNLN